MTPAQEALSKLCAAALPGDALARAKAIRQLPKTDRPGAAQTLLADPSFAAALRVGDKTLFDLVRCELYQAAGISKGAVREAVDRFRARFSPPKAEGSEAEGEATPAPIAYEATPGGIIWHKETGQGVADVALSNFTARIVSDVTEDDGVESRRVFELEGTLHGRTCRFKVPADRFRGLDWAVGHLGASAVVFPCFGAREHLPAAVQLLSGKIPPRTVYAHTGWRKIGDVWAYLHAGGAIGTVGTVADIEVELAGTIRGYILPPPPSGAELVAAVRASLKILDLGPRRLTVPLYAGIWRAAIHSADFSEHFAGETGVFKSELAALGQQHFGAGLDARHLPGAWTSTDNALESMASAIADAIFVVDDFCPTGSSHDVQRLHAKADRIFRGQGNGAGRQRMRADTTLRPARPPRGLIISTGEDTPGGHSLRARLFSIEVERGAIDVARLTDCQQDAAAGLYAAAMSGFVQWVAGRRGALLATMRDRVPELRQRATSSGGHRRTPAIVADLHFGLETFAAFAVEVGALDAAHAEALLSECWGALGEAAATQANGMAEAEPAGRFLGLLRSALLSGRAHVAGMNGAAPPGAAALGWRNDRGLTPGAAATLHGWTPAGRCVGWIDGEKLYLDRDAAFAAANEVGQASGSPLTISPSTLAKRLRDRGHLVKTDKARARLTVRVAIDGERPDVLFLARTSLLPCSEPSQPSQSVESHDDRGGDRPGGTGGGPVSEADCPTETPSAAGSLHGIGTVGTVANTGGDSGRTPATIDAPPPGQGAGNFARLVGATKASR